HNLALRKLVSGIASTTSSVRCLRHVLEDAAAGTFRHVAAAREFSLEARGRCAQRLHDAPCDVVPTVCASRLRAGDLEEGRSALDDDSPEVLVPAVHHVDLKRREAANLVDEAGGALLSPAPAS